MSGGAPRLGWYVHHHGRGHLTRLLAIAPHLDARVDCLSSLPAPPDLPAGWTWTVLERDDDGGEPVDPTVSGLLHWAPIGHVGHRSRLSVIAAAATDRRWDGMVVDTSVEVTLLARLLGLRTVVVTQPGHRVDRPHLLGFAAADTVLAPWARGILSPPHLEVLGDKVVHTGGISRFSGRSPVGDRTDEVVLLSGAGGSAVGPAAIRDAEKATGRPWRVLGAGGTWADDPWEALTSAAVVVSYAGQNAVADLAAARAPAIVVPQDRPFDEQRETGRALRRADLAQVSDEWPGTAAWPELVERASSARPEWERWEVAGAPQRAAAAIIETVRGDR
ncbi:glycosyltransferase [Microbacterium sp. NPDC091382]|uniref:glycosyltransferase n=1 Tax=Microbacterium sp. NPDC091382 TaxID=3364210 RepID=UPI003814FC22